MLEFGEFQLDSDRRELLHNGEPLPIQAKLFDTLVVLVENHDRVVEKQELLDAVWPDAHVEESSLFQTVSALRKALGNGKNDGARYIATIPGRGYRFVAPLKPVAKARAAQAAAGSSRVLELPVGTAARERRMQRAQPDAVNESQAAPWRRISIGLLAALAAVSAVTVALWLDGESPAPAPLRRFAIELDHAVGEAAISPNGRYIAYTRCRSAIHGFGSLWVRDLETGRTTNLVEDPVVRHVFWSPDSAFVAFGASYGPIKTLQKAAVPSGPAIKLTDLERGLTGGAWSPDGKTLLLATSRSRGLFTAPARGGQLSPLLELPVDGPRTGFFHPVWLPAQGPGPTFVVSQGIPRGDDVQGLELMLYRLGTGLDPVKLGQGFAPVYSPSGHLVYFSSGGDLSALPFSIGSMSPLGADFPIAAADGPQGPSVGQDGSLVYVRIWQRGREQLVWRDRSGSKLAEVGRPQFYVAQPQLSPDGRRATTVGGSAWGESIWLQDLSGQDASRLTFEKELDFSPVWSPDGSEVLLRSNRSGDGDLYLRRADGSGQTRKLFGTDQHEQPWDWSPDGRYILFGTAPSGHMRDVLYLERVGGAQWSEPKEFLVTEARERTAQFSPDGRFVAYVSDESGRDEVYIKPFPEGDGKWQVSKNGAGQPRWNPDGSELFYVEHDAVVAVSIATKPSFSAGQARLLFRDRGVADVNLSHTYDVSADGRRFIMVDWTANPRFSIEVVQNWYEEFRGESRD